MGSDEINKINRKSYEIVDNDCIAEIIRMIVAELRRMNKRIEGEWESPSSNIKSKTTKEDGFTIR